MVYPKRLLLFVFKHCQKCTFKFMSQELLAYSLSMYKRITVLYTFSLWNVHQINLTVWSGSGAVTLHGETALNLKLSVLVGHDFNLSSLVGINV